jgi:sterol desaturase/sphingolipid hydroxylase (fatty acid hydroxylase superfamily)
MSGIEAGMAKIMIFAGGILVFLFLEWHSPYRKPTESKAKRWLINLSLAIINSAVLSVLFGYTMAVALLYGSNHPWGFLYHLNLPSGVKILIAVLILDFLLYLWHVMNHEVSFFWRFHRVHHSDLNMDVTTATRFHFGELAMSSLIRVAIIVLIGVDWRELLVFDGLVLLSTQFHHSSLKVPVRFERLFWLLFVPPSMHRIHHSVIIKERNTNYGAILSIWDRLFGTFRRSIDQAGIRIGIGAYPRQEEMNLYRLLIMPFTRPVK